MTTATPNNELLFAFSQVSGPTLITASPLPADPAPFSPPRPFRPEYLGAAIVRILQLRYRRRRA